jgi:broad specificity phosphatase PhoE
MELKEPQFENRENLPFEPDLIVDFIRHGQAEYSEKERETAEYEGNLTNAGKEQIQRSAQELATKFDKENEIAVLWVSPRNRARQAGKIIGQKFTEKGIQILKDIKTVRSLSDVRMTPEFMNEINKKNVFGNWMEFWSKADLPEGTETPEQVKKRVQRVLVYLERIARQIKPEGNKKLHFICVGHEELFRDLLEEGFGVGTKSKTGPMYGEIMRIELKKSTKEKGAKLKLNFDNKSADLKLDKETRKFYKTEAANQ